VDPTGLAPVSLSGNSRMLLYTPRAQGPRPEFKIEKALLQGLFLYHSELLVVLRTSCVNPIILDLQTMSNSGSLTFVDNRLYLNYKYE